MPKYPITYHATISEGLKGWHIKWLQIFERTCDTSWNKINAYTWPVELIDTKINETNLVIFRITF